jgi:hypothetical protein
MLDKVYSSVGFIQSVDLKDTKDNTNAAQTGFVRFVDSVFTQETIRESCN